VLEIGIELKDRIGFQFFHGIVETFEVGSAQPVFACFLVEINVGIALSLLQRYASGAIGRITIDDQDFDFGFIHGAVVSPARAGAR
jgi:hypothetical protein